MAITGLQTEMRSNTLTQCGNKRHNRVNLGCRKLKIKSVAKNITAEIVFQATSRAS